MHVGLADEHRAGGAQAGHHGGVGVGGALAQEAGAHGGGVAGLIELVFDRDGHAVEGAERCARLPALGGGFGHGTHLVGVLGDDRPQRRIGAVAGLGGGDQALGDVAGGALARAVGGGDGGGGLKGEGGIGVCGATGGQGRGLTRGVGRLPGLSQDGVLAGRGFVEHHGAKRVDPEIVEELARQHRAHAALSEAGQGAQERAGALGGL